jgi:hypothetical protein
MPNDDAMGRECEKQGQRWGTPFHKMTNVNQWIQPPQPPTYPFYDRL